ncbi:MAG TPA: ABC transporter substrate-binding protein, partial [Myxococcaceae bacterium]|nr:ABC transporter substrate-binding protein [Myxococcaceae bacterium]
MSSRPTRRDFLSQLGVTTAVAVGGAATGMGLSGIAHAQDKPKGTIPGTPYKIGHMTFFTGAGAVLGEPMYKGNVLAADEINAQGGLLGKRKIEILKADEAAGTDANTKEM